MGVRVVRIFLPHRDLSPAERRPGWRSPGPAEAQLPGDVPDRGADQPVRRRRVRRAEATSTSTTCGRGCGRHPQPRLVQPKDTSSTTCRSCSGSSAGSATNRPSWRWNIGNELKAEGAPDLLIRLKQRGCTGDSPAGPKPPDYPRHDQHPARIWAATLRNGGSCTRTRISTSSRTAYHIDGNDKPSPEDDSDLLRDIPKPLLIEESSFESHEDRTALCVAEMDRLFARGSIGRL